MGEPWRISTHEEDVNPEEMQRGAEAFAGTAAADLDAYPSDPEAGQPVC